MRLTLIEPIVFKSGLLAVLLSLTASLAIAEPPAIKSRPNGGRPMPMSPPSSELLALGEANTRFALDLYAHVKSEQGNLFFSPYSISTALAMTAAGARGETLNEMTKTLQLPKDSEQVHAAFKELIERINGNGPIESRPYQLKTANALWGQKGGDFLAEFLKVTQDNYGAGLHEVDFKHAAEAARGTINEWVAKQTNDKIRDLIAPGSLTPQTSLVLTNAIYFLGSWTNPFPESGTRRDTPFHSPKGESKVSMMTREGNYAYAETKEFQAIEIPYLGGTLSMVVLLPRDNEGLPALETALNDPALLRTTLKSLRSVLVKLELPKFKLTESMSLSKILRAMGMPLAFDEAKADFSGMSTQLELFISEVIHKAFVDVNEKGTEAAAATAVIMMARAAMVRPAAPPISFKADHPFMFLIRDRETDCVLFLGRLVKPTTQ